MAPSEVETVLSRIEQQLAGVGVLDPVVEQAIEELLNLVERLASGQQALAHEVQRLKEQLQQKKKGKTTGKGDGPKQATDHSSEEHRRKRRVKKPTSAHDRRSFKDLPIHETIECPVDPTTLPPDVVRVEDESIVVQDIEIKPRNIRFERHVHYSATENKFFRGALPSGYDQGDFGADLRALILSLKYCGNMSEAKIREFLENFDVQISAGSVSNILTKTADSFEGELHDLFTAGLASTPYQQTDDTSARVAGEFWHTHIVCNPYYTAFSTRPHKDRLAVLEVLQNTSDLRFQFGEETRSLLQSEFNIPRKWQRAIAEIGDAQFDRDSLQALLQEWFADGNWQVRTAIQQAAALVYYRQQTSVPLIETIVCDDAPQFKLLTNKLALCWIHAGRHYERLSPLVARHAKSLEQFAEQFWDYYQSLQHYRDGPTDAKAQRLRQEFDELFSTRTGYNALDARIAKTAAKKDELLTVLSHPEVPLHNNASELGARVSARRRDVSLHSKSVRGARAMDIFTTIVQTAKKLGVSAYAYFRDRLGGRHEMPALADLIHAAASG
ncbi:MAG: hypothetical protein E4H00_06700 [Myxococcales bacterium]|nr:MAG: hypothetical protein E4H00_06700 [Myxococcales bacterium]